MDHGFVLTDQENRIRWCNHVLGKTYLTGQDEPFEGQYYEQVFGDIFLLPGEWEQVRNAFKKVTSRQCDRIRIDGLSVGSHDQPVRMIDVVLDGLVNPVILSEEGWVAWHFYDVTSYRTTEENLQALLRHSSDGIYLIDTLCRPLVFNPACERITGYDAQDVIHQSEMFAMIFIGEHVQTRAYGRAAIFLREGNEVRINVDLFRSGLVRPVVQESLITKRDGEHQWVEVNYGPVTDEKGDLIYLIGIVRDISRRRQMEEQLRLATKLATLGELTSAMAHEIKNPLGIIHSSAEIIMNPERPEGQKNQAAHFICEEARRLDQKIQVFLKF
jgi:PAS domain S-box-containing protein